jgi:hypothetical protein
MIHPARVQSCRINAISSSFMTDTKRRGWAQVQTQLFDKAGIAEAAPRLCQRNRCFADMYRTFRSTSVGTRALV